MSNALKKARVEHIKYSITGMPDDKVLKKLYRVVVLTTKMQGSKALDLVDWVGEVNATQRDMERLNKKVEKEHGITINQTTPHVVIYSPISGC